MWDCFQFYLELVQENNYYCRTDTHTHTLALMGRVFDTSLKYVEQCLPGLGLGQQAVKE